MYPVNQVFLGNSDPLLSPSEINNQMQLLKQYEAQLARMQTEGTLHTNLIWDEIDKEMSVLTESQKSKFFEDKEYVEINNALQTMVQTELINLVKNKIESNPEGRNLLQRQLKLVKTLKNKIIEDTNNEMTIFKKFREFSKDNPKLTYDEFVQQWRNM